MILKARIESGQYPKDERIPSESELMSEFEIGRTTARKAVAWLRNLGLVETVQTRGTYVI
jgi:GntR family transcriptional regulator